MKLKRILELGYYPVAPNQAKEGAQIVNGQWYMPRWGCDSLQHIFEEASTQPPAIVRFCEDCGRILGVQAHFKDCPKSGGLSKR